MDLIDRRPKFSTPAEARLDFVWKELESISVGEACHCFLNSLRPHTKRAYFGAFKTIFCLLAQTTGLSASSSLQTLALSNMENLLDLIRTGVPGAISTKQARSAAFVSFTRYLQRATNGLIRKAIPSRSASAPTFQQIRSTSTTKAMSQSQWVCFLCSLKEQSFRDYLIAKTILQGAKRLNEVLQAHVSQIDWEKNRILFRQSKSKELESFTIISYPESFMNELKSYLGSKTSGFLFVSSSGKPVSQSHVYRSFVKAGLRAGLPFKIHPHVLRASAITYFSSQGFHVDQIMKVSGHRSPQLVSYYNKSPIEDNISAKVCLI